MDPDSLIAITIGSEVTGSIGPRGGDGGQLVILFGNEGFDIGVVTYGTGGAGIPASGASLVVGIVPGETADGREIIGNMMEKAQNIWNNFKKSIVDSTFIILNHLHSDFAVFI